MQISRHWRENPKRYRLQGVRYATGEVSLQGRPSGPTEAEVTASVNRNHIHGGNIAEGSLAYGMISAVAESEPEVHVNREREVA